MKLKHCATLFFVLGLAVAFMGFVIPATAQDDPKGNINIRSKERVNVNQAKSITDQSAEFEAGGPQAVPAGGTHLIGTCYSSPLVIPAAAFSSDGNDPGSMFFTFSGGYLTGNTATDGCVKAAVYVPNGATMTSFYATVYDNDATYPVWVDLWRVNRLTGVTDWIATVETSSESTNVRNLGTADIEYPLVDYPDYAYYVTSCLLSSSVRLYAVRIYFSGPTS